ncbi:MAG: M20 family metallopeptidase [Saprospiraceae bacterium]
MPNLDPLGLLEKAVQLSPKLVEWRRHLHANPELSFKEFETQRFVMDTLKSFGLSPKPIADTGVIVVIGPKDSATCVAVRADMDALPILEVEGRSYGSKIDGVMHACGHDVHTTCALGAAYLLNQIADQLPTAIKFIFQPGEELLPGGATKIIAAKGLQSPEVKAIVALHVAPDIEVGSLGVRPGDYMASADEIYITLKGGGGHAAMAHRHMDLITTAAQMLVGLQQVVSRKAPPEIATVLSFGKIDSVGGATNVLASEVSLAGTFRTYSEDWRKKAHVIIRDIVGHTAKAFGAEYDLDIRVGYPALSNDEALTRLVAGALSSLVGADRVEDLDLRPTAEDFAWYLQEIPGVFFRLGTRNRAQGITAGVHTSSFDVDEKSLPIGAAALAAAALELAENQA